MQFIADIGVPMIGVYWPPAWIALAPVIAVEAWYARRVFGGGWRVALLSTTAANIVSTLLGIPVAWFVWTVLEMRFCGRGFGLDNPAKCIFAVTAQAGWLIPYESQLWWMIPAAAVVLTAIFLVMSVAVEGMMMRIFRPSAEAKDVRRWAWRGNLLSYGIILTFVLLFLYVPRTALDRVSRRPVNFLVESAGRAEAWLRR